MASHISRKAVVFSEKDATPFQEVFMRTAGYTGNGVKVTRIIEDDISDLRKVYDPSSSGCR